MTRRITNSLFFIFLLCGATFAQVSVEYKIITKGNIPDEILYEQINEIKYKTKKIEFKDSIRNAISDKLKSEGFYHFKFDSILVEPIDSGLVNCIINIDEGKPTVINKIQIDGLEQNDSLSILPFFNELTGQILQAEQIELRIGEALEYFEDNGYPFAKVKINSLRWLENDGSPECDIYLSVDKGSYSKIDIIEILGNEITEDKVILRETGIEIGDKYSQEVMDKIPERLNKLNFFELVRKPVYYLNGEGKGVLQLNIKEKQTNNFDGILGYVPAANEKENGYFTGMVNISLRNLFGTGRAFAVRWETENRFSQEFELKYLEPWLFSYPFNINLELFQRKQDTTYIKRTLQSNLDYLLNSSLTTSLIMGLGETIASQNASGVINANNSSFFNVGFKLTIDTRDDVVSPKKGLFFDNSYLYIQKKYRTQVAGLLQNDLQRVELGLSYYRRIFSNQIIAVSVHGKELRGSELDDGDMFLFGGMTTVRGYREKQFPANRVLWSNIEYRFLTEQRSYIFVFFDAGYYLRNENKLINRSRSEDIIQGYGFGVSLETGIGLLSVSYAIGKGSSLTQGLIHFGIINLF